MNKGNATIIVYLTQMFLTQTALKGPLKFSTYSQYDMTSEHLHGLNSRIEESSRPDLQQIKVIMTRHPYLEVSNKFTI